MLGTRRTWYALIVVLAFVACVSAPGCTCSETSPAPVDRGILACNVMGAPIKTAPPLDKKVTVAGVLPIRFGIGPMGDLAWHMMLDAVPSREFDPDLTLGAASGENGVVGYGASISGMSSITRCPFNNAVEREIRAVKRGWNDR